MDDGTRLQGNFFDYKVPFFFRGCLYTDFDNLKGEDNKKKYLIGLGFILVDKRAIRFIINKNPDYAFEAFHIVVSNRVGPQKNRRN